MTRCQKGFTILETMVTAGVAGALLLAATPHMSSALTAAQLKSSLRATAQYVRLARATAVGKNLQSRIALSGGGTTLTTQVLRAGTWTNTGTPLVLTNGTTVSSIAPSSSALAFSAQGIASSAVTITLQTSSGATNTVTVSILGSVLPG
ncbi:MAG TPA: type II secretion system protein [Candidatus Binatia bacterium]|nr:type II secretion system protein [Candidatus Binatia bacterium]